MKKNLEIGSGNVEYAKIDFFNFQNLDLLNSNPITFSYFGNIAKEFTNWKEMYVEIITKLWKNYPHIFDELIFNSHNLEENPINFRYITYKWQLVNPEPIGDFFCIDVPKNIYIMLENIKKMLDICSIEYKELEIFYKNNNDDKIKNKVLNNTKRIYTIDISKEIDSLNYVDLADKRPMSFICRGVEYRNFVTWIGLYKNMSKVLWDKYSFFITCSLKDGKEHDGLTLENLFDTEKQSPYELIKKLKSLLKVCSLPHENLILRYGNMNIDNIKSIDTLTCKPHFVNDNGIFEINLGDITTLDEITPVKFKYFDEEHERLVSWKQLYVKLFRVLWDDYGHVLNNYINKAPFEDDIRISFVKAMNKEKLTAPEYIGNNIFIETEYTNTALLKNIRTIFKLCQIDFEHLVIACKLKKTNLIKKSDGEDILNGEHKFIDFSNIDNLEDSKPILLKYKNIEKKDFVNWVELYVFLCKELYKDYGFLIAEWTGESFSGNAELGIDLLEEKNIYKMRYPEIITENTANNLYVETNYSDDEIVKRVRQVLDICCVDYKNIKIEYVQFKIDDKKIEEIEEEKNDDNKYERIDFNNILNLEDSTPLEVEYLDIKNNNFSSWQELYGEVLTILWDKYGFFIKNHIENPENELTLTNISLVDGLIPNEIVNKIKLLLDMYSISYEDFNIYFRSNKENIMYLPEHIEREILEINLYNLGRLKYTFPIKFIYCGKEYENFTTWNELYEEIFKLIWITYREKIEIYVGKPLLRSVESTLPDIVDIKFKDSLVSPVCISHNVFIETNYGTYELLKRIRQLVKICDLRHDELIIYYERFSGKEFEKIKKQKKKNQGLEKENKRLTFYLWLVDKKRFEKKIAKNYMIAIDEAEKYVKTHRIGSGKIYGNEKLEECEKTITLLFNDDNFKKLNEKNHHKHMAASKQYLNFINQDTSNLIM